MRSHRSFHAAQPRSPVLNRANLSKFIIAGIFLFLAASAPLLRADEPTRWQKIEALQQKWKLAPPAGTWFLDKSGRVVVTGLHGDDLDQRIAQFLGQ